MIDYTHLFTELQNVISKDKLQLTLVRVFSRITQELFSFPLSLSPRLSAERRNVAVKSAPLLLGSRDIVQECITAVLTVADFIQSEVRGLLK